MVDSKVQNMKMFAAAVGLIFSFFCFGSSSLHAQNKAGKYKVADEGTLFAKRYFSVSLLPLVIASKASLKGDTKKCSLKSTPQLSFEALINYHYNFEKNYSLILGLGGGVIGNNFDYVIPKEMLGFSTGPDITSNTALSREKNLFYIKLPVELERMWISNSMNFWNTNMGISLIFSPQQESKAASTIIFYDGQTHQYLIRNQNNNNNGKPWLNYHVAGGYTWLLPKNSIRANLKLNLSFTEFGNAEYKFILPNQPISEGRYGVTGSYLGLSLSYIFSGPNNLHR